MTYVKTEGGVATTYPYTTQDLKRDNPNVSFPKIITTSILESFGVFSVTTLDVPDYNEATQKVSERDLPDNISNGWFLGWDVSNMSDVEISVHNTKQADLNRQKRNQLLSDTDYFALTDVTMDAAMTTYRQELRDVTAHANWPNLDDEADWPTKP